MICCRINDPVSNGLFLRNTAVNIPLCLLRSLIHTHTHTHTLSLSVSVYLGMFAVERGLSVFGLPVNRLSENELTVNWFSVNEWGRLWAGCQWLFGECLMRKGCLWSFWKWSICDWFRMLVDLSRCPPPTPPSLADIFSMSCWEESVLQPDKITEHLLL